jgi:hypothetical protein
MTPEWRYGGAMDLAPYVQSLSRALAQAGTAGGEEAEAFLERFVGPLESAIRLTLLTVLSAAAEEISATLGPGAVDVRLRGGDPQFVVNAPRAEEADGEGVPAYVASDEGQVSRVSLRLPERLKSRIDELAGRDGLSTNAWMVRVVAAAIEADERRRPFGRGGLQVGQSYVGWSR